MGTQNLRSEASVVEVARGHNVKANPIYRWRREAKDYQRHTILTLPSFQVLSWWQIASFILLYSRRRIEIHSGI
jgi:hypothetical protein